MDSLCKEIELVSNRLGHLEIDTIFFGGGTPSIISIRNLEKVVDTIHRHFKVNSNCEFTIECNPGTDFQAKLKYYRQFGINRISIGIQSLSDDELTFLGRIHNAKEAISGLEAVFRSGFENVNGDVIYAVPGQTLNSLKHTLESLLEFPLKHISAYSLIFEEGTSFFKDLQKGKIKPLPEELDFDMYCLVCQTLAKRGFSHYEISNFARPGYECRHNLKYWNWENYIGFGTSAHSFIDSKRYWNVANVRKYNELLKIGKLPIEAEENIDKAKSLTERVMLGFRSKGIDIQAFKLEYSVDLLSVIEGIFSSDELNDFFEIDTQKIKLNDKGYFVCDEITTKILQFLDKMPKTF